MAYKSMGTMMKGALGCILYKKIDMNAAAKCSESAEEWIGKLEGCAEASQAGETPEVSVEEGQQKLLEAVHTAQGHLDRKRGFQVE